MVNRVAVIVMIVGALTIAVGGALYLHAIL